METATLSRRDHEFREPTPRRETTASEEKNSAENFKVTRESLNRQTQQMTLKSGAHFRSIQGNFIYRHHKEPRVQLCITFPIPLKFIDVTRSTHTNLDVLQEKRIDGCWNVDSHKRPLSDSWKEFTKFLSVEREASRRMHVVRSETDKSSNDYQT